MRTHLGWLRIFSAILFGLLLNSHTIIFLFRSDGLSPLGFSEWDEGYYLPRSLQLADRSMTQLWSMVGSTASFNLDSVQPQTLTALICGSIAKFLGLNPVTLGLFLDLTCAACAFLLATNVFSLLVGSSVAGYAAAISLLAFPWLIDVSRWIPSDFVIADKWVVFAGQHWDCAPILRSPFTQLSYIPLLLTLKCFLMFATTGNSKHPNKWLSLGGISSALSLYVYAFSWLTSLAILLLLVGFNLTLMRQRGSFTELLRAGLWHLAIISPGLWLLHSLNTGESLRTPLVVQMYFGLPLGPILLSLIALLYLLKLGWLSRWAQALSLIGSLGIAELLLVNLQPLLGRSLYPYHFTIFYLVPLTSGATVALLVALLLDILERMLPSLQRVRFAVLLLFAFPFLALRITTSIAALKFGGDIDDVDAIRKILSTTTKESVIAVVPVEDPTQQHLQSIAGRQVLFVPLSWSTDKFDRAARWHLSQLLRYGEQVPASHCKQLPTNPVNFFTSGDDVLSPLVEELCPKLSQLPADYTPCTAVGKHRFDLAIVNNSVTTLALPHSVLEPLWQSRHGKYTAYQYSQTAAIKFFCEDSTTTARNQAAMTDDVLGPDRRRKPQAP